MNIQSLKLVCFSPTGTTKSVILGIARGINNCQTELIDITCPESRNKPLLVSEKDLLIIGVPVYMGRVPASKRKKDETRTGKGRGATAKQSL